MKVNMMFVIVPVLLIALFYLTLYKEGYQKKNGKVYYKERTAFGVVGKHQISCDYKTFTIISANFAKDEDKVFYRKKSIENADSKTFTPINKSFSKDKNSVYYKEHILENATPKLFIIIENSHYSRDDKNVYCSAKKLEKADPNSFQIIEGTKYSKDKNHLYSNHYLINGADPNSFSKLNGKYFKDKNDIYYDIYPLESCSVENFEIVYLDASYSISKDGCFYYIGKHKVPSNSYKSITYYEKTSYFKDDNFVYQRNKKYNYDEKGIKLFDIDIATFSVDKYGNPFDKNGLISSNPR